MTPITLFKRYVWLIDTIYSTGTISKEEIDRRWSLSSLNDKHESRIPRCTFFRQKGAIQDLFGVTNFRAKYLCSLPLHHTQKVVRTDEQYI